MFTFLCVVRRVNKARNVRFEVSTAVTMMIIIFWEMIIIKARNYRQEGVNQSSASFFDVENWM
jgi:hypothetical protein